MQSSFDSVHAVNYSLIEKNQLADLQRRASIRDFFLEQDSVHIQGKLKEDLGKYYSDAKDLDDMKLITLDYFIPAFLDKICSVYNTPPIIKIDNEGQDQERLEALFDEVDIKHLMADNMIKMKMHNTIMVHCKWVEDIDRLVVEQYNAGTSLVYELPEHFYDPMIVAYPFITDDNTQMYIIWDRIRGLHYFMTDTPIYDPISRDILGEKFSFGEEINDMFVGDYFPWVTMRYRRQDSFWGNGMDSLIELIRSINLLLTVLQDDTIREAIRLLIMGFEPTGTKDIKGKIKTGLRNPIFSANAFTGEGGAPTQILSADLYTEDVLKYVDQLVDMVSATYSVESVLKTQLKQDLSGIALRIKNEPLLRQWASDIMKVTKNDLRLVEKLIECNNYHRPDNQINPSVMDTLIIDYQQPKVISDEKADYELAKMQMEDGVISAVDWVQRKNPEMSRDEAEQYIKDNIQEFDDLFGMSPPPLSESVPVESNGKLLEAE